MEFREALTILDINYRKQTISEDEYLRVKGITPNILGTKSSNLT